MRGFSTRSTRQRRTASAAGSVYDLDRRTPAGGTRGKRRTTESWGHTSFPEAICGDVVLSHHPAGLETRQPGAVTLALIESRPDATGPVGSNAVASTPITPRISSPLGFVTDTTGASFGRGLRPNSSDARRTARGVRDHLAVAGGSWRDVRAVIGEAFAALNLQARDWN